MGGQFSSALIKSVVHADVKVTNDVTDKSELSTSQNVTITFGDIAGTVDISNNTININSKAILSKDTKVFLSSEAQTKAMNQAIQKLKSELSGLNLAQLSVSSSDVEIMNNMAASVAATNLVDCTVKIQQSAIIKGGNVGGNLDIRNNKIDLSADALAKCYNDSTSKIVSNLTSNSVADNSLESKVKGLSWMDILAIGISALLILGAPVVLPLIGGTALASNKSLRGILMIAVGGVMIYFNRKWKGDDTESKNNNADAIAKQNQESLPQRTIHLPREVIIDVLSNARDEANKICTIREVSTAVPIGDTQANVPTEDDHVLGNLVSSTEIIKYTLPKNANENCVNVFANNMTKGKIISTMLDKKYRPPLVIVPEMSMIDGKPTGVLMAQFVSYCSMNPGDTTKNQKFPLMNGQKFGTSLTNLPVTGVSYWVPEDPPNGIAPDTVVIIFHFYATESQLGLEPYQYNWENKRWVQLVDKTTITTNSNVERNCVSQLIQNTNTYNKKLLKWIGAPFLTRTAEKSKSTGFFSNLGTVDYAGGALIGFGALSLYNDTVSGNDHNKYSLSEDDDDNDNNYIPSRFERFRRLKKRLSLRGKHKTNVRRQKRDDFLDNEEDYTNDELDDEKDDGSAYERSSTSKPRKAAQSRHRTKRYSRNKRG